MLQGWRRKAECPCKGVQSTKCGALPLCEAKTGNRLKVTCIEGGRKLCARMAAMGIYPGAEVELLCAGCGSPCLIRVHGSTLSLGAGISEKILVTSGT
jgi:ferrous iron transport protein A